MRGKLPQAEQVNAEDLLWAKSAGVCFLCERKLNRAADDIEADHDVPGAEGGPTTISNLNLAHVACNRAKRNAKTIPIRPYLRLVAFADKRRLKYDGFLPHFGIQPAEVMIQRLGDRIEMELPDGGSFQAPVMSESNAQGTFEYAFVSLPRAAIFNDEACQPRALRMEHAWAIYADLQRNVLHEPPSCRTELQDVDGELVRLLMFDGQHKTIANWMMGREVVTAKLYLNLSDAQANELVNSVQAKIKKLPLSPFELAGKMSDEWENKFHEYEEFVGAQHVSEAGFLAWLPATERARGKQAMQSALVQNILSQEDLRLTAHVSRSGTQKRPVAITEQQLKSKVIERLIVRDATSLVGEDAQAARDKEASNVLALLNGWNDLAFEPRDEATELTPQEVERARRMTYQASLAYVSGLLRQLWFHVAKRNPDPKALMTSDLDESMLEVNKGIARLVEHPAWTCPFDENDRMRKLKLALEKNQGVNEAMEALGLDLAYLLIGSQSASFKAAWKSA